MDNAAEPVMDQIAEYVRRFGTPEQAALLSPECSLDIWVPMSSVNAQVSRVQRLITEQIDADIAARFVRTGDRVTNPKETSSR